MGRLVSALTKVTSPMHTVEQVQKVLADVTSQKGVEFILSPTLELEGSYGNKKSDTVANGCAFTWNRSPLKPREGLAGKRLNGTTLAFTDDGETVVVGAHAQFEMSWRFYASNIDVLEEFELLYNLQKSAAAIRYIPVATTNLGDFTFTAEWGDLETLEFTSAESFGMFLEGTCVVEGLFLASRPRDLKDNIILSINTDVSEAGLNVVNDVQVVPDAQNYQE